MSFFFCFFLLLTPTVFVQFPIGPGSEGPLGAMAGMDPMHMNGGKYTWLYLKCYIHLETYSCLFVFLGSGDLDGLPKVIIIFLTFFFFFLYLGHNKNLSVKEYFIVLQESVLKLGNIFALPVPSP